MWVVLAGGGASLEGAAEEAPAPGLGPPLYLGALALTVVLVVAHMLAPRLRALLTPHAAAVGSFGAGMAAAYVFLHLLPELDAGHALLGVMVFVLPLFGFVLHYLVKHRIQTVSRARTEPGGEPFWLALAYLALYNLLIVYVTPQLEVELGVASIAILAALVLHLIQSDYGLGREHPRPFDRVGRYVVAAANVAAYAILAARRFTNEMAADIVTAFLAGTILFKVFREEIPDEKESRIAWFIGGVALFSALVAIAG